MIYMKEINVKEITNAIADMAGEIACVYDADILQAINQSAKRSKRTF